MLKKSAKSLGKQRAAAAQLGYEKRQARKAKSASSTLDLYEHVQEKSKRDRSKVGLEIDRDEAFDYAVALDGVNEEERENLRARLIGEFEDDEEIPSEDDEELDSDAAFDESDEERFGVYFAVKVRNTPKASKKQKTKSNVKQLEIDLNEDDDIVSHDDGDSSDHGGHDEEEEEYEEMLQEDGGEVINLVDVLDGKGGFNVDSDEEGSSRQEAPSSAPKSSARNNEEEVDEEEDEESEEDDEPQDEQMEVDIAPSEDEDIPEALDQLQDFVSNLDVTAKKRKALEEDTNLEAPARKRRPIAEKTEAGEENEFRARSSGLKLNLDDLLAPLEGQSSALQSLKKSTKVLAPSASSKAKTLSAPLPHRAQERLDRQAAYEQTKEEVDKWTDTMKRIREAEHLSFPLQAQSAGRVSNLELNAKFKPTTELESAVDALLKSAKMREEDITNTEAAMLKMNNLSVEEVAQRRAELRKMRELAFRTELKARRANKIKSKTYRKLKRKEKERLAEKIDEEDENDPESQLKHELDRARERATLKHKHTGKWARQMRQKEGLDENSRRDIEEMLERGEKLRRRIQGVGSGEEEESDDNDDDEMDVEAGIEKIKQSAFDELRKLDVEERDEEGEESGKKKSKSVFEMTFMKDAMARQSAAARRDVDDFIKEIGGAIAGDGDSDEGEMQDADSSMGVVASRTGGRIVFRPAGAAGSSRPIAGSDTSSVTLKSTDLLSPPPLSPPINTKSQPSQPQDVNSNPWLAQDMSKVKVVKKTNEVIISKGSKAADKSKNKLKKVTQKRVDEREKAVEDAAVEISLDNVMVASSSSASVSKSKATIKVSVEADGKKTAGQKPPTEDDDDSEVDLEIEVQEQALALKGKGKAGANGLKAFEQRDLVALAFAGDNVVQSFEEAKKREIASDAPREVDTTIPGWGSWGGTGTKKAPPKQQRIKKIPGIDPTTRADYNKKNIIISEKRDKKAGKYLVKDLPYPYTSKAQFERAMERPLGVEWNTRVGFQRGTLPKVVKKPGIIIDPLEKLHS
ncbi:Utp14 protein-domain-containing protein [Gymnopilus junonius]|uniref:Utp14 protein-domain-containing protein n=1 Tax=Gymnopilus junonius TaxID=109634 RepID=A0A9P5NWJ5_GYMJU|nr:Utp14 protein-domain-containing protein [Gymnopilus junonius]